MRQSGPLRGPRQPATLPLAALQESLHLPLSSSVAAAVGRTPLIRLRRASEETGCTILGKAEFMNPGQSVKDRAAFGIIRTRWRAGT